MGLNVGELEAVLKLKDEMSGKLTAVQGELLKLQKTVEASATSTNTLSASWGLLSRYLGTGALLYAAKKAVDFQSALDDLSQQTGLSTQSLQKLDYAAGAVGLSIEELAKGISMMSRRVAGDDKAAAESIARLGLSLEELQTMAPEAVFLAIAREAAKIEDPMRLSYEMTQLFGKSGVRYIPLVKSNLEALAEAAPAFSSRTTSAMDNISDSIVLLLKYARDVPAVIAEWVLASSAIVLIYDSFNKLEGPVIRAPKNWLAMSTGVEMEAKAVKEAQAALEAVDRVFGETDQTLKAQIATNEKAAESWREWRESVRPIGPAMQNMLGQFSNLNYLIPPVTQSFRVLESAGVIPTTRSFAAYGGMQDLVAKQLPLLWIGLPRVQKNFEDLGEAVKTGGGFLREFSGALTDIPGLMASAFTGGGGLGGAVRAIGSKLGAVGGAAVGAIFGGPVGAKIGSAIGSALGGIVDRLARAFGRTTQENVMISAGRQWGLSISKGLADEIAKLSKTVGSDIGAMMLSLGKIIDENGGVLTVGIDKSIGLVRDLFSAIETGKLEQVGPVFDDIFGKIMPNAIDKMTGLARADFLELISLSKQFGVESEAVAQFTAAQTEKVLGGFAAISKAGTKPWADAAKALEKLKPKEEEQRKIYDQLAVKADALRAAIGKLSDVPGLTPVQRAQLIVWKDEYEGITRKTAALAEKIVKLNELPLLDEKQKAQLAEWIQQWEDLPARGELLKKRIEELAGKDQLTPAQQAQLKAWRDELAGISQQMAGLGTDTNAVSKILTEFVGSGQAGFDRLGRLAVIAFTAAISGGTDFVTALEQIGPSLDDLTAAQTLFGFTSSGTFAELLKFRQFVTDNKELAEAISGVNAMMSGLNNLGLLSQETFDDLTAIAVETFRQITAQGLSGNEALLLMQPTLQTIWKLQKDFGFIVDDATQALIDQGLETGILGAKHQDAMTRMADATEQLVKLMQLLVDETGGFIGALKKIPTTIPIKIGWEIPELVLPVGTTVPIGIPPPLAAGGVALKPTLALIGEAGPEAVVPLNQGGREAFGSRSVMNELRGLRHDLRVLPLALRDVLLQGG